MSERKKDSWKFFDQENLVFLHVQIWGKTFFQKKKKRVFFVCFFFQEKIQLKKYFFFHSVSHMENKSPEKQMN